MRRLRSWLYALFIDIPYIVDSAWRRIDLHVNREFFVPPAGVGGGGRVQGFWRMPAFWFFVVVAVLVAYGPTLDGLCTAWSYPVSAGLVLLAGAPLAWLVIIAGVKFWTGTESRVASRFGAYVEDEPQLRARRRITRAVLLIAGLLVLLAGLAALGALVRAVFFATPAACAEYLPNGPSLARLVLCLLAIAAFAVAWSVSANTTVLILTQAIAIALLAAAVWWWLAAGAATEASGAPYRHAFALLVPLIFGVLCLAPLIARLRRRSLLPFKPSPFEDWLAQRELFARRGEDPELSLGRVLHALLQGVGYRVLQLLMPPALTAFVVPRHMLFSATLFAFAVAVLLSAAGNMSPRWKFMSAYVERWLLRGTAFFVSLFVILVAGLRLMKVDYVATIIDSAPFGVLFTLVAVSYVLSWMVEYWINRVAAGELLRMLGGNGSEPVMPYRIARRDFDQIDVDPDGALLMYHGIGRFLVAGRRRSVQGPAFHSYGLLELVRVVAGEEQRERAAEVVRHTETYFVILNLLLAAVAVLFGYLYFHYSHSAPSDPVIEARSEAPGDARLKDLAERLLAPPGDPRPALVVAASGGGTRAALYTAHVLEGLHRMGADRDIVLVSGVSGGGVALAYFAANYERLAADDSPQLERWREFREAVTQDFIRDVMEGAAEWRILGPAPLTALLAESFERRLLGARGRTLELPRAAPALILNTTVTGHPLEDSRALAQTVDEAPAGDCGEQARPYRLMTGGRLVFTDLKNVSAFPGPGGDIADVRLPYRVVRDPRIGLAQAAALNANFPPVFPNARVLLKGYLRDSACADRSYYVTDGGALENLGLVSALFAVRSALSEIKERCDSKGQAAPHAWCERRLRPIHFVLAEASAASYDYQQDRGVSAALAAKERMTGGVTNFLVEAANRLYAERPGANPGIDRLQFHYIAMPLAFRTRGGFGTHWMQADDIEISDPRARVLHGWSFLGLGDAKVSLGKEELTQAWSALHDPDKPYCGAAAAPNGDLETVRRWICGAPPRTPRDLHVDQWRTLVGALRP